MMAANGEHREIGSADIVFCSAMAMRASLREKVEAAAVAGFSGLTVSTIDYDGARAGGLGDSDIRRLLSDHGLVATEAEALLSWLADPSDAAARQAAETEERRVFDVAAAVGARSVVAIHLGEAPLDVAAAAESFALLCDRAAERGLAVCIEFLPWTAIPDLRVASVILTAAGRANGRVVIDSWHLFRSGGTVADLAEFPPGLVGAVQLSDAPAEPAESLLHETLSARLLPGEGALDLIGLVRTLDRMGSRAPLGLEVISKELGALPPRDAAERAMRALRSVLSQARA
jgi:sugar phosphate isomerase/epimerase